MVRLPPGIGSGFPRLCLTSGMPYNATHPPLVQPDVRFSRIRLSPERFTADMQRALIAPVSVGARLGLLAELRGPERDSKWQPAAKCRSGACAQAVLTLDFVAFSGQGSLAPPELPGFPATMSPSDSRPQPFLKLCFPPVGCGPDPALRRVSQVPRPIFRRAPSPSTPRSPAAAGARCFTADGRLRPLGQVGHSLAK